MTLRPSAERGSDRCSSPALMGPMSRCFVAAIRAGRDGGTSTWWRSNGASARTTAHGSACAAGVAGGAFSSAASRRRRRVCCARSGARIRCAGRTRGWCPRRRWSATTTSTPWTTTSDRSSSSSARTSLYTARLCVNGYEYVSAACGLQALPRQAVPQGRTRPAHRDGGQRHLRFRGEQKLSNFDDPKRIGLAANRRLLGVQRISHDPPLGQETFDGLHRPAVVDRRRASAPRVGDPRVQVCCSPCCWRSGCCLRGLPTATSASMWDRCSNCGRAPMGL